MSFKINYEHHHILDLEIPTNNKIKFWHIMDDICDNYKLINKRKLKLYSVYYVTNDAKDGYNYKYFEIFTKKYLPNDYEYILPIVKDPHKYDLKVIEDMGEKLIKMNKEIGNMMEDDIEEFIYDIILDLCETKVIKTYGDLKQWLDRGLRVN